MYSFLYISLYLLTWAAACGHADNLSFDFICFPFDSFPLVGLVGSGPIFLQLEEHYSLLCGYR